MGGNDSSSTEYSTAQNGKLEMIFWTKHISWKTCEEMGGDGWLFAPGAVHISALTKGYKIPAAFFINNIVSSAFSCS